LRGWAGKSLEIGDTSDRFSASAFGFLLDFCDQRGTIDQCKFAAFVRDATCDAPADPLGRSGDDRNLAGEACWKDHCLLTPAVC